MDCVIKNKKLGKVPVELRNTTEFYYEYKISDSSIKYTGLLIPHQKITIFFFSSKKILNLNKKFEKIQKKNNNHYKQLKEILETNKNKQRCECVQ